MTDTFAPAPNKGVLFSQKAKKSPNAPDYRGEILVDLSTLEVVDGKVMVKIAGWKKTSKTGSTFLSLAVDVYKPDIKKPKAEEEDLF